MALTDESSNMVMPVAPAYGGGYNNGFMGGDGWWIILLLLAFNGGWGMGGFGGGMWGMEGLYPWLNNSQNINDGFRDQMLQTSVSGISDRITAGFGDVQNALCSGFAGVNANITNAQMANMQSIFGVQSALQNCCCENRAGIADLKYTVATENCADRAALSDGIRDLLAATQAQTQTILTQLCNDKIEQKNDTIAQLRQELLFARGQASQDVQTAALRTSDATTANQLIQELRSCPIPAMPVYGQTPIFSCNNGSCGCGCNG
ncbi:MAG: hypothetical protein IJG87_06385 [Ruminococcus sp.]|nr:hypothetical protein [Ruminococcus sp.]